MSYNTYLILSILFSRCSIPGGLLYTVTDVKDLYEWEKEHCNSHPLFELITESEIQEDISAQLALTSSEESKKVDREGGEKYIAVFRRVESKKING